MALEELSEFFGLGEHGTAATFTPSGGSGSAIVVVYNNLYFLEDAGNVGVETSQPIVTVESATVPGVAHGDVITIDSANFNVVGVRPDGTGITELVLEKQ
jgi:pectate lyase